MAECIPRPIVVTYAIALAAVSASAQGTASVSLSGTVGDKAVGRVPGASVTVKNNATAATFETVTNNTGTFSVPSLDVGAYTVRISLSGFRTVVMDDVRLQLGVPAAVSATLEVGALEETVLVVAASELVSTQTATVSANLNVDQINRMPLPTRNALNAVTFMVGVNTAGINRDSNINGLPESFINITLDGVSNNDNFNKSDDG